MTTTISGPMPLNLTLKPLSVGEDYRLTWRVMDDNRAIQDTTDWDMSITLREKNKSGKVIVTLTTVSGITHTPGLGRFDVHVTDTVTATIKVKKVAWDMKLTDAAGLIAYPAEGIISVLETVTK